MNLSDFDFELPPDRIARFPVQPRDHSRLLVVNRKEGTASDHHFYDLPNFLVSGDLLVLNETKVLPARLFALLPNNKEVEVLLLDQIIQQPVTWNALLKGVTNAERLSFREGVVARVQRIQDRFLLEFEGISDAAFFPWLEKHGHPPLPPYMKRFAEISDRENYQTVFAKNLGSVAAPTAGLHFTHSLLAALKEKQVEVIPITLHVGYGTFAPIRTENLEDHSMHEERYSVPDETWTRLQKAKAEGRRIIAVGTTSLRTLESIPQSGLSGSTRLFIRPGYSFQWVNGLITNFHTPRSSLLVLVCALLGKERTLQLYEEAVQKGYRFYSYGDAMAIF